jgi:hypothetical protein
VLNKKYEGELSDYIDTLIGRITWNTKKLA